MKEKIHLSAFGIWMGGGLVLLESLLPHLSERLVGINLDIRLPREVSSKLGKKVQLVPREFLSRLRSVNNLARNCKSDEILFCFNSLPPTVKCTGKVIVYVHAPHFVGLHVGVKYDFVSRIRFVIERLWFYIGAKNVNEFWVQTQSMQRALLAVFPNSVVRIMPFVDEKLASCLQSQKSQVRQIDVKPSTFIYPADGVGHKNHVALLQAWEYLATKYGKSCPQLLLTLSSHNLTQMCSLALVLNSKPYIINLGPLKRQDVLEQLKKADGLIFPSRAETFGLPLLEATALQTPILVSELDYSRDVCIPAQTFDPRSAISIARAVERHLGLVQSLPNCLSAAEISQEIK